MPPFAEALGAFSERFPTAPLLPLVFSDIAAFRRFPLLTIDLVPLAAPSHPLAAIDGRRSTGRSNSTF